MLLLEALSAWDEPATLREDEDMNRKHRRE